MKIFNPSVLLLLAVVLMWGCGSQNQSKEESVASEPSIVGKEISYVLDTLTMNGFIAYDENSTKKKPGIIVVHEWWGHNDYARERAMKLAKLGYVALAVDMYGDGAQAAHPQDAMKFASTVMGNFEVGKSRFDKAVETLKAQEGVDAEKIAAIGYCFGGSVVLSMANTGYDLDAVAAFHSGVQLPVMPDSGAVKAKMLVCNGADDPFISAESVDAYKSALDAAGADYKYVAYPGAVHAFTSKGADSLGAKFELPLAYNAEADEKSWAELQELLNSTFQ